MPIVNASVGPMQKVTKKVVVNEERNVEPSDELVKAVLKNKAVSVGTKNEAKNVG